MAEATADTATTDGAGTAALAVRDGPQGERVLALSGRLVAHTIPAVWREKIAVGICSRLARRICSPKPGSSFSTTASVASGVRSRGAGPVPPS